MNNNNDLPVSNPAQPTEPAHMTKEYASWLANEGRYPYRLEPKTAQPRGDMERVLEVWPDATLAHYHDGAVAVRVADAGGMAEYIGWGQITVSRDAYAADLQAWADAASRLPSNPAQGEGGERIVTLGSGGKCECSSCAAVAEPAKGVQPCKNCGKSYGFHTYPNEFCPGPDLEGYGPERYEPIEAKQPSPEQGEQPCTRCKRSSLGCTVAVCYYSPKIHGWRDEEEQGEPLQPLMCGLCSDYEATEDSDACEYCKDPSPVAVSKSQQGEQEGTFEAWWGKQSFNVQVADHTTKAVIEAHIEKISWSAWLASQAATVDSRDVDWEQRVKELEDAINAAASKLSQYSNSGKPCGRFCNCDRCAVRGILGGVIKPKRTAPKTKDGSK